MVASPSKHSRIHRGSGVIDRSRLLEKLQGAWDHRLTLISAPPGYGKTTLVAQFVSQQSRVVIWHSIEERERDVPNLYAKFVANLAEYLPDIKRIGTPYGYAPSELAVVVADYLRETLQEDIIIILDDVHLLAGALAAETWLRTFVSHAPPTCHLVLLSRIVPDLPLIEMVARREILAIGQDELRLTPQEIYWLGYTLLDTALSDEIIQQLNTRLEGWPAGVTLALQPLPTDVQLQILRGSEGPEALFNALARQMLDAQPQPLRHFLLASSTFKRFTPELCESAFKLLGAAEHLVEVQSRNMFVSRVPGGLVYHNLFRNFLQGQLADEAPGLFASLHERAASWFEQRDDVDNAFDHYLLAGQALKAGAIAERVVHSYFVEGKVETLLDWNARLSEAGIRVPRLLYRCGIIQTERYDYPAAIEALQASDSAFAEQNDELGRSDVKLQWGTLELQRGGYHAATTHVNDLISAAPGPDNIRGRALNVIGFASLQTGNTEKAVRYLEEALPLYREYADAYAESGILQNLGIAYWRRGRLRDALSCLQEVVALRRALGGSSALAAALNILGFYYVQLGDYNQALTALQEGLSSLALVQNRRYESYLLMNLGNVQRNRGAYSEALSLYRRASEIAGDSEPSLRCTMLSHQSTLYRWQGNFTEAIAYAEKAVDLAEQHGIAMEGAIARMLLLTACAQQGKTDGVLADLEQIVMSLQRYGEMFAMLQGLGLCAHVAMLVNDTEAAHRHLQAAVKHAEKLGTVQPLLLEILHASALENFLQSSRTSYKSVLRDLKRLRDLQIGVVEQTIISERSENVSYHLHLFTMGQVKILRDGKPVDMVTLRRIGRDIFLYLLFTGASTREEVSAVFWPESSSRQVRQNFHTMLFRIRKTLGDTVITRKEQRYLINPDVEIWCDALEAENLVRKARLLPPNDARTEDMWRRAVDLCQGDFLPDIDTDWTSGRRESLREAYIDALLGLGDCAMARDDLTEALRIFKQAAELDPYREDIHQSILKCYAAKGNKRKVRDHLTSLKRRLHRELGAEVSDKTRQLAETLLK